MNPKELDARLCTQGLVSVQVEPDPSDRLVAGLDALQAAVWSHDYDAWDWDVRIVRGEVVVTGRREYNEDLGQALDAAGALALARELSRADANEVGMTIRDWAVRS